MAKPSHSWTSTSPHRVGRSSTSQHSLGCVSIDDDLSASRRGFEDLDRPVRLRLVADGYGLNASERHVLVELLDVSMESGGSFVQRRVEAGNPNFIRMLEEMGGMERYERRLWWWQASRKSFVQALG